MKFLVTEFICPFCDVWITPGRAYKSMLAAGVISITVAVPLIIFGEYFYSNFKWFGISLSFISLLCIILSKLVLKYEIKE